MSDPTAGVGSPQADERLAYRGVFQRALVRPEIGAAIGAISIWIFFWAVSVPFGKASGASSILDIAASPLGIMAVAVAFLMIGGEFDLSAGAATGALGIVTILLVRDVAGEVAGAGFSLWIALPISLAAALGLGWWNGFLVNRTSLPSFIVTLGSFFVLKGAKLGFSKLIVDQIQVGKLDDLAIYAAANNVSDKGYGFLNNVFAYDWLRTEHIWESRDWAYTGGMVAGFALIVLALYELHFRRREALNPVGLLGVLGGMTAALIGIWQLHATDSIGGNTVAGVLIGLGILAGFIGFAMWRYTPAASGVPTGSLVDSGAVVPLVGGLVSFGLAIFVARWFDSRNGQDLSDAFSLGSGSILVVAVLAGVVGAVWTLRAEIGTGIGAIDALLGGARTKIISGLIVWFGVAIAFLNLATEQGARAIIFIALGSGAAIGLLIAAARGRKHSDRLGSALLLLAALAVAAMAFFIRAESQTPKFRSQAFTVMLVIAALMAAWAVVTTRFEVRRFPDVTADRMGRNLGLIGAVFVVGGLVCRLLWVTQADLDAGLTPSKFSVRILWFLAFTAVATWVLGRTRFGSWTFAVGGNKEAARQVGVPAARTRTQLFMLVSFAAWLVGILLAFRLNTIQASTGDGQEFEYIIAAVVGGTALTGGYGSTLGAGIGALIMAMAFQGIPSARWNSDWRYVFVGSILLLAVIANNFIRTRAESAR